MSDKKKPITTIEDIDERSSWIYRIFDCLLNILHLQEHE